MFKLTNHYIPEYRLYLYNDISNKKNLLVYKFSIKFIHYKLNIPSIFVPFKYKKSFIVLSTEETFNFD